MNEFKQAYLKAILERDDLHELREANNLSINMHAVFGMESWGGLVVKFDFSKLMKELNAQIPNGGIPFRSIGLTTLYKLQSYMLTNATVDNFSLRSFNKLWKEILHTHKHLYAAHYYLMDIRESNYGSCNVLTRSDIGEDNTEITPYYCSFKDLFVTTIVKYII